METEIDLVEPETVESTDEATSKRPSLNRNAKNKINFLQLAGKEKAEKENDDTSCDVTDDH